MKHQGCIHHWLIDSRNHGTCKKCGATTNFSKLQKRTHRNIHLKLRGAK